jgi:hypothetical protein
VCKYNQEYHNDSQGRQVTKQNYRQYSKTTQAIPHKVQTGVLLRTWQRGDHHVEVPRLLQQRQRQQLEELVETPGPAMHQQQRHSVRVAAGGMYEVDGLTVDWQGVLREAVEQGFMVTPVVLLPPVLQQLLHTSWAKRMMS